MPNTITVDVLKETGYTTWFDFVFHITGYISSNGHITYSYKNKQGDGVKVALDITQNLLERMALEEAKLTLPLVNVSSFLEFKTLLQSHKIRRDSEFYYVDVVVRTKEDQIVLKSIHYRVEEVERLEEWEKTYKDDFVYIEKVNKIN